jgi:hypothetical protein
MKKTIFFTVLVVLGLSSCHKDYPPVPGAVKNDSRLISGWIGLHLQLIRNTTGVTHIAFSRHFSYTGVALYESLAAGAPGYRSIASKLSGVVSIPVVPKAVKVFHPASANASIAAMLRFFYGANAANVSSIDSLEQVFHEDFAEVAGDKFDMDVSVSYGRQVATVVSEWSKGDHASDANIFYSPKGEGYWEPTPAANLPANMPGWGNNRAIVVGSADGAMPVPPAVFSNDAGSDFYKMVKKVYDASNSLTTDQKSTALFWDDAPNGKYVSVFGHWFSILKQVLDKEKTPLLKGAEAYLLLGAAMNDATISCWQAKYNFHTIRPITYIRKYMGDAGWNPIISTPPHPEYSSAHSTISGSGVYVLTSLFGNNYHFTDHTYDINGMSPRSFSSFNNAAMEAGMSRFYAGIHYLPSIEAGNLQGIKVGSNIVSRLRTH